jgi:predicted phosphoribosyltransferase
MNTFTADTSLQQSLANLSGLTAVRDSQGVVLGYFSPTSHQMPEAYVQAAAQFDPDEMKRRKASLEAGGTTAEVLGRIAELER